MPTLLAAIEEAKLNYKPGKRINAYTSDMEDIKASAASAICACRGMCGSHTGPCSMQSSKEVKGSKMCKACAMSASLKAGGPGSGPRPGFGKMHPRDVKNLLSLAEDSRQRDKAAGLDKKHGGGQDAKDHETIAKHISNGQYNKAANHMDRMDTSPRDEAYDELSYKVSKKMGL